MKVIITTREVPRSEFKKITAQHETMREFKLIRKTAKIEFSPLMTELIKLHGAEYRHN